MSKYTYTCPDVIHQRKIAKRNVLIQLGLVGIIAAVSAVAGWQSEKHISVLEDLNLTPEDVTPTDA